MNNGMENAETSDPDYQSLQVDKRGEINQSLHREDARDLTVQRIKKIIQDQFSFEIELKEKEVLSINRRVHDTRRQLDRLRACILAGYYGYGSSLHRNNLAQRKTIPKRSQSIKEACQNEVMKWKQSLPSTLKEQPTLGGQSCKHDNTDSVRGNGEHDGIPRGSQVSSTALLTSSDSSQIPQAAEESESRFYIKRRVIVGNTSKYILPEHRERNDRSTHKWMVYVRGPKEDADLQTFISKVWFLLHPSYQPNDLVEVCKPPFQVTRRGWGEFPVRVQLHFVENRNKRVDIIHHLKLDKTYTGLQTLGSETHVDIELDRKNFEGKSSQSEGQPMFKTEKTTPISIPVKQASVDSNANKLDLLMQFDHHFNDHSYSAPAKKLQSSDEGLRYPTPPISVPGSRCSSPETMKEILPANLTHEAEVNLRRSVQQFPIVNHDYNPARTPYCARTLDQYFGWHIGKRLAAEWQRSLSVKKHASSNYSITNLSTKDIMNYCRFHGYTPMKHDPKEGKVLCKVCGEEKVLEEPGNESGDSMCEHCDSEFLGSLTCGNEFLESCSPLPKVWMENHDDDDGEMYDIDVVSVPEKQSREGHLRSKLLYLPMTEELEWIQNTAAEIDVHLQGTTTDGVRAPVTTAILYRACGLLIEDILRKANRFTWKNPSVIPKTKCILPTHIKQAAEVIPHCDFLTNKYLGVVKPDTEEE